MAVPKRTLGATQPAAASPSFPIVGVGASAGGLEAFRQMLGALPVDTGMGFVFVQHLSPTHASLLAELLARMTAMPVTEVRDEPRVEPNHVYVIPPDRRMCIQNGSLRLLPREERGEQRAIDYFFHSLAGDQGALAVGVVLSGTATDGTLGLLEIKAVGGVTFAQDATAQEGSMPRSAIDSGCVDFVLSPEEIARELGRIARRPRQPQASAETSSPKADEPEMGKVFALLRGVTGVDFSSYKTNTFSRRIRRRMFLSRCRTFEEYVRRLASDPVEVQALYQDVLIHVTSFFRNPAVFEAIQAKILPALFKDRSTDKPLRVWVPGCSTGEEAYSLAITIAEFAEAAGRHLPVQIFATDLNETLIDSARKGRYPEGMAREISPERLRRFFIEEDGHYRVVKSIREQCIFARHNLLTDPPFSRLDLIGCRNFLIYLDAPTQKRVVRLLHYALNPNGYLVLGSSETAASHELFEVVDARHKIFRGRPGLHRLTLGNAAEARKSREDDASLQSLNEELETSTEELQSANEELCTVNEELQNRNQELHQSTSDMVNLLGSVDTAILMLDSDLRIRRFTPAAETILSLIPANLGRPIGQVKLTVDLPELETWLAEVLATANVVEREVQDRLGHWYLLRIRPYRTLEGGIDGAVLMFVDIDHLKSAHQFAKDIVATVREALLVLDTDLCVQTASESFYRSFGRTPEETEGRLLYDLSDLSDAADAATRRPWDLPALRRHLGEVLAENGSFEGFEIEQDFAPVGHRTLLLNARRLANRSGSSPLILLAIEDITSRKALEGALGRQVEELALADRSKNEFLALLAHELRNPLAPLRNALNLLETPGADPAVSRRALEVMHRQIRNMARLIDDLLDVSRITRGKVLLRKEPLEITHLIRRSAEVVQHDIDSRGQRLTLGLGAEPTYLDADATRIEQIFGNLLHNASKFTPPGGHIEVTIGPPDEAPAALGEIVVRVRDDGIGIAPEMLPRVFDLFVQAQRSLDRSQGGLGIGLTLVRSLVELHGGTIEARSGGLGKGSEFLVRLPLLAAREVAAAERREVPAAAGIAGIAGTAGSPAPRRVLVVDDNVDAAESLGLLLRLRGHEVEIAFSGPTALEAAAAFQPEVVLLDIGLPGLDGYEVARALRQEEGAAQLLLVALTGYGQEEDRRRAREAGFDHHLTKPIEPEVIYGLLAAKVH